MVDRYKQQLRQQLWFIKNSCDSYDRGDTLEGIRIAVAIRVILHQTSKSTSLLTHLGAQDVLLLSTTKGPSQPGVDGFTGTVTNFDGMALLNEWPFRPKLGKATTLQQLKADDWWNQAVMVLDTKPLSRKFIVLTAANKDGGAHVDSTVPPEYEALIKGVWEKTDKKTDTRERLADHHALCLRQFGYELINSPDLSKLA